MDVTTAIFELIMLYIMQLLSLFAERFSHLSRSAWATLSMAS